MFEKESYRLSKVREAGLYGMGRMILSVGGKDDFIPRLRRPKVSRPLGRGDMFVRSCMGVMTLLHIAG